MSSPVYPDRQAPRLGDRLATTYCDLLAAIAVGLVGGPQGRLSAAFGHPKSRTL